MPIVEVMHPKITENSRPSRAVESDMDEGTHGEKQQGAGHYIITLYIYIFIPEEDARKRKEKRKVKTAATVEEV